MEPRELKSSSLPQGSPERAACKLAKIAAQDVYFGGARALVLLKRMKRSPNYSLYADAVDQCYHCDYAHDYTAWECPECGSACFGRSAAYECCAEIWQEPEPELNDVDPYGG